MQVNKRCKVGLAQLLVEGGEPRRNVHRAIKLIHEAYEKKCDIVLLPEVLDFGWTHPSSVSEATSFPNKWTKMFSEKAKEYGIYICVGLTEKSGKKIYNTALLYNRNGEIILKYRKINLLDVEFPFYEVGQELKVVDTEFGKIGINICSDNYPSGRPIGHTLARMGAQIILSPSSWTVDYHITEENDPYGDKWVAPLSELAKSYGIIVASTTSVGYIVGGPYEGKKMVGCSLAVGPQNIISQGPFNELASDLIVFDCEVPERREKGTNIGKMLEKKGIHF